MPLPPQSRRSIGRGRELRESSSISEKIVWERLRQKQSGFKFRRQHEVGPYILDFYCAEAAVCVEIDGEQHELRKAQDARRDKYLQDLGILTVRVPSLDFFEETRLESEKWVEQIVSICEERAGRKSWDPRK